MTLRVQICLTDFLRTYWLAFVYHYKVPATKRRVWQSEGDHYCAFMLPWLSKRDIAIWRYHEKEISHSRASFWLLSKWIPVLNSSGHSWIALRVEFSAWHQLYNDANYITLSIADKVVASKNWCGANLII